MAAAGWLWIILPVEGKSLALLSLQIHSAHKAPDPQRGFSAWDKEKRGIFFVYLDTTVSFVDGF